MNDIKQIIENAWNDRTLLQNTTTLEAINEVITQLDLGKLRVAEKINDEWQVNDWIKKAVILYFPTQKMETIEVGPFEFHDKIPLKRNYACLLYTSDAADERSSVDLGGRRIIKKKTNTVRQ